MNSNANKQNRKFTNEKSKIQLPVILNHDKILIVYVYYNTN